MLFAVVLSIFVAAAAVVDVCVTWAGRLPSHLQEMMTKMTKVSRAYEAQYGREPSLAELAKELGVDPERIQDTYEAVFTPRSLDQPVGDADGATLGDLVEVRGCPPGTKLWSLAVSCCGSIQQYRSTT
jgi:hypothetical protein